MGLKAWRAAFDTIPELESYQHLKRLSGLGLGIKTEVVQFEHINVEVDWFQPI